MNTAPTPDPVYTHTARNVVDLGKGPFPARVHPGGRPWYLVRNGGAEHARHESELILRRND